MRKAAASTARSVLITAVLLFVALPGLPAFAQEFHLESDTLVRFFERDVGGGDDLTVPIYEYLRIDGEVSQELPLSFHAYGWGRLDIADSSYYGDSTAGELLYGYLEYTREEMNMEARLGRLYIFEGVANESIDGLRVESSVTPWLKASAYAGWPVSLDAEQGRSGDSIFGGRLAHQRPSTYEIGLSYKNVSNDSDTADERVGADLSLFLPRGVNLYGFSNYNLSSDGWAEHSYEARFNAGPLRLRPFFEYYRYEDYFDAGEKTGGPFRFLAQLDEKLSVFGSDVLWMQNENWEWLAKGKYYNYDQRDDHAFYLAGLVTWHGEDLTQAGGELGRMDGDRDETQFTLTRLFFYYDQLPEGLLRFLSGEVVWTLYDEDIYGESSGFFLSLGTGTFLLEDKVELRVAADYSADPYFDNDLRGWLMAKIAYDR